MARIWLFLFYIFFGIQSQILGQPRLFPCSKDGKMGYCDEKGNPLIEARFEKALPFQGPLAAVSQNGNWWMIHQSGLLRFNSRLDSESEPPFHEKGLYKVEYFDPIFANVREYYNRAGLPVKVLETENSNIDTLPYLIFNPQDASQLARTKLGLPYGTDGLDCSGFIRFVYGNFGIVLPYFTKEIAERGRPILEKDLKMGDLIFLKGANASDQTPNHVGMVLSVKGKEVQFIHASNSKGISINRLSDGYYKMRFLQFRRMFD